MQCVDSLWLDRHTRGKKSALPTAHPLECRAVVKTEIDDAREKGQIEGMLTVLRIVRELLNRTPIWPTAHLHGAVDSEFQIVSQMIRDLLIRDLQRK